MVPITANDPQLPFIGTEPEVKNIPEAQNRNEIQIHPDGECNDIVMAERLVVSASKHMLDVKLYWTL